MTSSISDLDVENVAIIVGDAVRWDATKSELSELGKTVKTVAASTHTPTSFTSMLTGHHPSAHGVYGFHQSFTEAKSLFDADSYDTAFGPGEVNGWLSSKQAILGQRKQAQLEDMEPPFIWMTRDFGGHAPYNRYANGEVPKTSEGKSYHDIDSQEYLDIVAGNTERIQSEYNDGIIAFFERIDSWLDGLEEAGLAEDTLVIVTSDHGELLGEYGQVGHDYPMSPELIHVPTTFIHPNLDSELVESEGVMRHIDLLPTVFDAIGEAYSNELPGEAICFDDLPNRGFSMYNRSLSDYLYRLAFDLLGDGGYAKYAPDLRLTLHGLWDERGGHVFNRSSFVERNAYFIFRTAIMAQGKQIIRNRQFRNAYRSITERQHTYGTPRFDVAAADAETEELAEEAEVQAQEADFSEDQLEQLEDLGYL